ncbi:MAG: hypothetical protein ACMXYF_00840 [Candidatus Woesearchaeota archaeon]
MKKQIVLIALLVLGLSMGAFAQSEFSVGTVTVDGRGSSDTNAVERSNPQPYGIRDRIDDQRELNYVRFLIPVTAVNGTIEVQNVQFLNQGDFDYSNLGSEFPANEHVFRVTLPSSPIENGSTANIRVDVLVPSNLDAVDTSLRRIAHDVNFRVTTNASGTAQREASSAFYVTNNLQLDSRVDIVSPTHSIRCRTRDGSIRLDCDRDLDEMVPGEDFNLRMEVLNRFSRTSDVEFDDVLIDILDSRDVEARDNSFRETLRAGEDIQYDILFRVDSRIRDRDQETITITAEGLDINGARHGFEYEFTVRFRVPDYDLEIRQLQLTPTQLCAGDFATVRYELENKGSRNQDNVRIQLENTVLGLDELEQRIRIDDYDSRDNDHTGSFDFVVPSDATPRTYPLVFTVFHRDRDSNNAVMRETLNLQVQDCSPQPEQPVDENGNDTIDVQPPAEEQPRTQPTVVATPTQASDNNVAIIGLSVLLVLLFVIVVILFVYILRK